MDKEKIIKTLKEYKPKPSKAWKKETLVLLNNLEENVTIEPKPRNRFHNLFNFLSPDIMSIKLKALIATITGVLVLATVGGVVYASDSANPGDFLFPLEKTVEQVQVSLTNDPVSKAKLEMKLWEERLHELEKLSEGRDTTAIALAISEIEAQQITLRTRLQELNQLRVDGKLQTEEQLKVLEQLLEQIKKNDEVINRIQEGLLNNGESHNLDDLNQIESENSQGIEEHRQEFEDDTGIKVEDQEDSDENELEDQNRSNSSVRSSRTSTSEDSNENESEDSETSESRTTESRRSESSKTSSNGNNSSED